jgi:peptidoglycan/xylan/chitin deacetylase (PgdA/CDA1 family)
MLLSETTADRAKRVVGRRVKSIAGRSLTALGLHRRLLGDRGVVVAFHRVTDAYQDSLTCSVKDFESFCAFFRQYFTVIPLAEMVERLERSQPLSGTLAVTFDDGYRDNYEFAAPVLRAFALPATFFVVSDFIESDTVALWDRECVPPPPWMSWEEVRGLHDHGFEIGGHTRTHANLGEVAGTQAEWEITSCRRELETRLGTTVRLFAYPYGRAEHMTDANRELVRQAGFRCCASCYGGTNPRGGDSFRLRRIPISSWFSTPSQLAFEMALRRS